MAPMAVTAPEFTVKHDALLLGPHGDTACTHTVPLNALAGKVTVPVNPVPTTDEPATVHVQIYELAPGTASIVYISIAPWQGNTFPPTAPGVAVLLLMVMHRSGPFRLKVVCPWQHKSAVVNPTANVTVTVWFPFTLMLPALEGINVQK